MRREKALRMSRGLEALHAPLPLAGGLMRVLRAVVQIPVLPMFDARQDLLFGCAIAAEFIRDDDPRHIPQALQELAEEFFRRVLVPPALHQDIEHMAILIDGPPQIMTFAMDGQKHLI